MLATPTNSEAKVVFTPTHQLLTGGSLFLDLNSDGVTDFTITESKFDAGVIRNTGSFHSGGELTVAGAQAGNQVLGFTSSGSASALNAGFRVGASDLFLSNTPKIMEDCFRTTFSTVVDYGKWRNAKNKFLGLKFTLNGKIHFGWARLSVQRTGCKITALLTGYAVETVVNKSILTGQTQDAPALGDLLAPDANIPSLGILAQGAPVLDLWRRKEDSFS